MCWHYRSHIYRSPAHISCSLLMFRSCSIRTTSRSVQRRVTILCLYQFWIAETLYREIRQRRRPPPAPARQLRRPRRLPRRPPPDRRRSPPAPARRLPCRPIPRRAAGRLPLHPQPQRQRRGTVGVGVNFVPVLSKTPTGLSFSQIAATNVGSGPSVTSGTLTPYGCEVTVTASTTGAVVWTGKYTTIGA